VARIPVHGAELAFEDSGGEGPAVVLVHGLGGSLYGWRAQARALADAGYRAIAYDQRGAGLSTSAGAPYSIEGWAEDLAGLVDALGLGRVALVGHSMGCMVAENAAIALGERCWALAVLGGRAEWPEGAGETFGERAALAREGRIDEVAEAVAAGGLTERHRAERPELWGLMVASVAANDPEAYAEAALATARGSMRDLGELACPVLAFAGSEDVVTPPDAAEEIAARAPHGEAATVEGGAHWCMLSSPDQVNRLLLGFLDRRRPD
jgi:pimeloyl-ACP methyl ester carboxylesterase